MIRNRDTDITQRHRDRGRQGPKKKEAEKGSQKLGQEGSEGRGQSHGRHGVPGVWGCLASREESA